MMRRVLAILGSALFLPIGPGVVAGLVPWWISRWDVQAPLFGFPPIRALGVLLIVAGIPVLLESFARFALQGVGTPAPVFPTRHLVVKGFYRYVRNYLPSHRGGNSWSGRDPREREPPCIRSACLAGHLPVRRGIRGADVAEDLWGRVRRILCQCASVGPSFDPMGRECRPDGQSRTSSPSGLVLGVWPSCCSFGRDRWVAGKALANPMRELPSGRWAEMWDDPQQQRHQIRWAVIIKIFGIVPRGRTSPPHSATATLIDDLCTSRPTKVVS